MKWKKNRIVVGAVAFASLLIITLWAVRLRNLETHTVSEVAAPKIERDSLTQLEVTRPGQPTTVLTKRGEQWWVTSPVEALADSNTVTTALNRLAELKASGIVATRAENHARLEVDDAQAVHVIAKVGENTVGDLRIGKYAGGDTMVRFDDGDEVYGISGSMKYVFDRELKSWRDRKIVDTKAARAKSIVFENESGKFAFKKAAEDEWVQVAPKKKLKKFDPKKVKGLVSSVARLTATAFAEPEITVEAAGLGKPTGTVTLVLEAETGTDAEAGAEPEAATEEETIVVRIGGATDKDGEFYVQRQGDDTVYVVSKYLADRLRPDKTAFHASEAKPPPSPGAPPTGLPQIPQMPGGQQLPPEVMKQLQEQLKRQQQGQ